MNVSILDSYLIVTIPQVNLGKHLCSSHLIKEVIKTRKRILVLHSDFVQLPIINTQPECTIFLLHKQNWCSLRRHTRHDILLLQEVLQLHLQLKYFWCTHYVWCLGHWCCSWHKFNYEINVPFWRKPCNLIRKKIPEFLQHMKVLQPRIFTLCYLQVMYTTCNLSYRTFSATLLKFD